MTKEQYFFIQLTNDAHIRAQMIVLFIENILSIIFCVISIIHLLSSNRCRKRKKRGTWWEISFQDDVLIQRVYRDPLLHSHIYAQKSAWGLRRGKDGLVFRSSSSGNNNSKPQTHRDSSHLQYKEWNTGVVKKTYHFLSLISLQKRPSFLISYVHSCFQFLSYWAFICVLFKPCFENHSFCLKGIPITKRCRNLQMMLENCYIL